MKVWRLFHSHNYSMKCNPLYMIPLKLCEACGCTHAVTLRFKKRFNGRGFTYVLHYCRGFFVVPCHGGVQKCKGGLKHINKTTDKGLLFNDSTAMKVLQQYGIPQYYTVFVLYGIFHLILSNTESR